MRLRCWLCALLTGLLVLVLASNNVLQAGDRVISVTGIGEVKAKPSVVELSGKVTGDAELAGDAVVKYNGNRRRAVAAIEGLEIEGLEIVGGGITINSAIEGAENMQMMAMNGNPVTGNQQLQVSEPLAIKISGIEKMSTEELIEMLVKVVDAGKDAGIVVGAKQPSMIEMQLGIGSTGTSLATFSLSNVDSLEEAANKAAIENARTKAEQLAKLSGVKLGPIVSIKPGTPPEDEDSANNMQGYYAMIYGIASEANKTAGYSSSELREISVRAAFQIEFSIVD